MKKGFTLVEVSIAMFIGSIIVLIGISLFSHSIKSYKEAVSKDREEVYSKEALRFIEGEINDVKNKFIRVEGNQLILRKLTGDKYTIKASKVSESKSKIVIIYDKVIGRDTTDIILEGIADFKVKSDKNLIYINIYTHNGEEYERCFGTNKLEKGTF